MNKVINNKRYDTETAREVGSWENMDDAGNFGYTRETLYRKRTGEHFLHGEGGAASRYASYSDDGWSGWGETIRPMSYDAARDWAERHMAADAYEAAFGSVPEDAGNVPVTLSIPASAKARLEARAARTGETQSAIVARLIETL